MQNKVLCNYFPYDINYATEFKSTTIKVVENVHIQHLNYNETQFNQTDTEKEN